MKFILSTLVFLVVISCKDPLAPQPTTNQIVSPNKITENNQQVVVDEGIITMKPSVDMASSTAHFKLKLKKNELLSYIQSAIIPSYKNWVIFENGTYLIFDNIDTISNIQQAAIQLLKHYQPKNENQKNWDCSITDLDLANGWSIFGNGYGIYTFVHSDELAPNAGPQEIGAYAKAKRTLDEKNPRIIYISSSKGILEVTI